MRSSWPLERKRRRVAGWVALSFGVLIATSDLAYCAALDATASSPQPQNSMPQELSETDAALAGLERSDCLAEDRICRQQRMGSDGEADNASCSSRLMLCLAALPVGRSPPLPAACMSMDQEAFRRLEQQGELLDADPTLFAESFVTLIRARIACRAGDHTKAFNLYDEIAESMRQKLVPSTAAASK